MGGEPLGARRRRRVAGRLTPVEDPRPRLPLDDTGPIRQRLPVVALVGDLDPAVDEVELDGTSWINTLGLGTYWGGVDGLYVGLRGGIPVFATSTVDNYGRSPDQTLLLGFDAEFSVGWRF